MEYILQIKDMSISFVKDNIKSEVVKNLNLNIKKGEILAIVGETGSGKTIFTHGLMGILPENAVFEGEIYFDGIKIQPNVENFILIPQTTTYLDPLMKISKQISLKDNELSKKSKNLYPFQCSGGMIRNALFSLVYEKNAPIIVADEPTVALDLKTALKILESLKNLANDGKSVILITHDIDLAVNIADRVAVFKEGKILEVADKADFFNNTLKNDYTKELFRALPQNDFEILDLQEKNENFDKSDVLMCENLSFKYKKCEMLFENLNFKLKQGERVCIFAKSGFGKSTFAKILAGYEKPTKGTILPDEKDGFNPVQMIFQHPEMSVNPKWTVYEILNEGGDFDRELLAKFGIDESYFDRLPSELSGGELQRICIIRSIKKDTKFLICDEITTMLDAITQAKIWKNILEEVTKRNIGLLVITHNEHLAHKICEKVIDFEKMCGGE